MSQSNARNVPAQSGDIGASGERRPSHPAHARSAQVGRRRWLILAAVVLLVAVAVGANLRLLTHYQDAQARLQDVTTKVDSLQAQKNELQGELAKLSETGYLETLARQQLTYVRPGEELYIVTDGAGTRAPGQYDAGHAASSGGVAEGAAAEGGGQGSGENQGFLEKIISAIRGLF